MFYIYYDLVSGEFASQLWKQGWNNNNYHVAVSLVSSCHEMSVISSYLSGEREWSCALWASCLHLTESPACTETFILRCFSMCCCGKKFFHLPCLTFLYFFVSSIFYLFFPSEIVINSVSIQSTRQSIWLFSNLSLALSLSWFLDSVFSFHLLLRQLNLYSHWCSKELKGFSCDALEPSRCQILPPFIQQDFPKLALLRVSGSVFTSFWMTIGLETNPWI